MGADFKEATTNEEDQIDKEIQEDVIGKTIQAIIRTQENMVTRAPHPNMRFTSS